MLERCVDSCCIDEIVMHVGRRALGDECLVVMAHAK